MTDLPTPPRHLVLAGAPTTYCELMTVVDRTDDPAAMTCPECIVRWTANHGVRRGVRPGTETVPDPGAHDRVDALCDELETIVSRPVTWAYLAGEEDGRVYAVLVEDDLVIRAASLLQLEDGLRATVAIARGIFR